MDNCPHLCDGCPMLPMGVRAVIELDTPTEMGELRQMTLRVITSANPYTKAGDTTRTFVASRKKGQNLREAITSCLGPHYTWLQKLLLALGVFDRLGGQGRCGCIDHRYTNKIL